MRFIRFIARNTLKLWYQIFYYFSKEIKENPEIITMIDGGLGSQMGQYAMGQEIQRVTGIQVSYDLSWYKRYGKDSKGKENRLYELENVFPNIKVNKANKNKIMLYRRLFNAYQPRQLLNDLDKIDLSKPPIYLGGYWKTKKYSDYNIGSLREMFEFGLNLDNKNKEMLDVINSCDCPVAIQIRLGDYSGSVLDVTNRNYFLNAIKYLYEIKLLYNEHFFVFSDDINKSKQILASNQMSQFTYVNINDNDHGAYDMFLMSQCNHFIISNSTFGFWAALLSAKTEEKIVIQPNKWLKTDTKNTEPMYPGWICLDC